MTNDELTTDDGTNVEKLIQQKSYNALFDNNEGDNGFEFLWNWSGNWDSEGKLPSYVKLPTTMTFAFKTPSKLDRSRSLTATVATEPCRRSRLS